MSNSIAPGSSADVNVKVTALTTNPNVPVTYKTIILKKNLVNGVNTLTREMMSAVNTKYVVKYDFTLGEDITVPANCVLEFDGGSVSGEYTITGANTDIQAGLVKIFNTDVTLAGSWNIAEAYPEWFGAKGDGVTDDGEAIEKILNFFTLLYLTKDKVYNIGDKAFVLTDGKSIKGSGTFYQMHNYLTNNVLTLYGNNTVDGIKIIVSDGSIDTDDRNNIGMLLLGNNIRISNCYIEGKGRCIFGDATYGHNTVIENCVIKYTIKGIYLCIETEDKRTGLLIENNYVCYKSGYTGPENDTTRAVVISGYNGAIVKGNTMLGAPMSFGVQNQPSSGLVFTDNICDVYISIVKNNNIVSNNVIDFSLRPDEHCPYNWPSGHDFPGIEVAGCYNIISNNQIKGLSGNAITNNGSGEYDHNDIIGNVIQNCRKGIILRGTRSTKICNNTIENCAGSIAFACGVSDRRDISKDILIADNIIIGDTSSASEGAVNLYGTKDVIITNNIVYTTGYCIMLGVSGYHAINTTVQGNKFYSLNDNLVSTTIYANKIEFNNNICDYSLLNSDALASIKSKDILYPYGYTPNKNTYDKGELFTCASESYQLLRCKVSGTYGFNGYYNEQGGVERIKISTESGSNEAAVDGYAAIILTEGQHINIEGGDQNIIIKEIEYNFNEHGRVIGATVILKSAATQTINNGVITFSNPEFEYLYIH